MLSAWATWSSSRTTQQPLSSSLTPVPQCPWYLVQHLHRAACSPPPTAAITTGPERSLTLHLKDSQSALYQCNFDFITGDVEGPILGIDFLRTFHMTVDLAAAYAGRSNGTIFPGTLFLSLFNPVFTALPPDIQPIISTFSDDCSTKKSMPMPGVDVKHFLQTERPPVTSWFRHLDSDKLRFAKEIFADWEQESSSGPTASGAVLSTW